jgi:endo-1,3(4)-beta-glucanase
VPRLGITDSGTGPIETNKFYANIFLGTQGQSVFTEPYSLMWSQGSGNAMSYGMSVSHVDASQRVFGPPNTAIPNEPNSYYINPIGIQSIIFSAAEFGSSTTLTSDSLLAFSANIHLSPKPGSSSSLSMPVVQGMAYVTGLYDSLQPVLESSVFFRSVASAGSPKPGMYKYEATLEDGNRWLIYAVPNSGIPPPNFQLTSSTMLQGIPAWSGLVQVAKNPISDDTLFDDAAGTYPTTGSISGYQTSVSASYSMSWTKGGAFSSNTTLLMYALPHHLQSFDTTTSSLANSSLQLDTTTKGRATAVIADSWTLVEELPVEMGFYPYQPGNGSISTLSAAAIAAIQNVSAAEASQNMSAQTDLNSMYYSGKALSKFA